jgi:anaerobic selenocysteine-containing dehydrogenase
VEFASKEARRLWHVDPVPAYAPLEPAAPPGGVHFPLHLLSCKTRDRIHSQFGNLDWVRDIERPHRLEMNPEDAHARGLEDGDRVLVANANGELQVTLRIAYGLGAGVVHLLEGRCHEGDPQVNLLTGEGVTDMGNGATFYDCFVEVRRT